MSAPTATRLQIITDVVETWHEHDRAIRGIRRNDGRTAATAKALAWHQGYIDWSVDVLIRHGERELLGLLSDEAKTAERLRRTPGRPELLARQRANRRALRALLAAAAREDHR